MTDIIRSLVLKDARRLWVLLCAWGMILIFKCFLYVGGTHFFSGNLSYIAGLPVYYHILDFLEKMFVAVLIPLCLHQEPTVGSTAFWFSRPLSRRSVLATKALFLGVFFVCIPLLAETAMLALSGVSVKYMFLAVPEIVLQRLGFMIPFILLASITGRFSEYAKLVAMLFGMVIVWCVAAAILVRVNPGWEGSLFNRVGGPAGKSLTDSINVVVKILTIICFSALIIHQYLTRYTARTVRWAVVSWLLISIVVATVWNVDFLEPKRIEEQSIKMEAVSLQTGFDLNHVSIIDSSENGLQEKVIRSRFVVSGFPQGFHVVPEALSSIQMRYEDGVVLDSRPAAFRSFLTTMDERSVTVFQKVLGDVEIKNSLEDQFEYNEIFKLSNAQFEQYKGKAGIYAIDLRLRFFDFKKAFSLALKAGNKEAEGNKHIEIYDVQQQGQDVFVTLLEQNVDLLFDRSGQKNSIFDSPSYFFQKDIYVLVNPQTHEAILADMGRKGLADDAMQQMFNEGLRLKLQAKKYYFNFKDAGITDPQPWLKNAQLVYLESRSRAVVNKNVRIENFALPSVSTDTNPAAHEAGANLNPENMVYDESISDLKQAQTETERFYALGKAAKASYKKGNKETAKQLAEELQTLIPKYRGDWNYGNAIQDVNIVLGRLALSEGKTEEAKEYLLAAGRTPGSPQLDSFGPDMSLAKDLLEKGEKEAVLQYLTLCGRFWSMDWGKLKKWEEQVQKGKTPDFGANLLY